MNVKLLYKKAAQKFKSDNIIWVFNETGSTPNHILNLSLIYSCAPYFERGLSSKS